MFATGPEVIAFVNVVQQMLEDVQERLVYKAQAMLDNEVKGFTPTPSDLNYPDRLAVPVCMHAYAITSLRFKLMMISG